jgi:hypothetical protein
VNVVARHLMSRRSRLVIPTGAAFFRREVEGSTRSDLFGLTRKEIAPRRSFASLSRNIVYSKYFASVEVQQREAQLLSAFA